MNDKILSLDEIGKMEQLTVHNTPLGEVSFMVPADGQELITLNKSYVSAHYRRLKDGKLVFVAGYSNKKHKKVKVEDLKLWHAKHEELAPLHHQKILDDMAYNNGLIDDPYEKDEYGNIKYKKNGKPKKKVKKYIPQAHELTDKYTSFHFGDEVFVKYSHMHDQHYGVGAVVGVRDDPWHDGILVQVKFPHSKEAESYAPESLAHVHKKEAESRTHESSTLEDALGNEVAYKHMSPEQRKWFYDQYWLLKTAYHMSMVKAFKEHKEEFKRTPEYMKEHGLKTEYPQYAMLRFKNSKGVIVNEGGMTLDELHAFEDIMAKGNYVPVVPIDSIVKAVQSVDTEGNPYDKAKHFAKCKQLLQDIKKMEAEGVPLWQNKVYVPKSKKKMPKVNPDLMGTMEEDADLSAELGDIYKPIATTDEIDPNDFTKLESEMEDLVGHKLLTPDPTGVITGNPTELHYAKPIIVHGQVKEAAPEGTHYKPAPVVPDMVEQAAAAIPTPSVKTTIPKVTVTGKAKEAGVQEPMPIIPAPLPKKEPEAPKHVVHAPAGKEDISDLHFTFVDNAENLGFFGGHSKYVFKGSDGQQYLYKPFKADEGHRVWAEIIPAQIAKLCGHPAADFGSKPVIMKIPASAGGTYAGSTVAGSMQRIIPNIKKADIAQYTEASGFTNCPKDLWEQLQRESVIDWLVGNHDPHAGNYIIDNKGQMIGIDKGQSFKFYGKDKLTTDYNPNYDYQGVQLYNRMYEAGKKGTIKLDFNVVNDFIHHLKKNLSASEFVEMVKPFAEQSAHWHSKGIDNFLKLAQERYANLESDFKTLYKSAGILKETDASTGKAVEDIVPKKKPSAEYDPHAFMQLDHAFHGKVKEAHGLGHSLVMGGGDVRDMGVTFTHYNWDKGTQSGGSGSGLEVSMELMPHVEQKLLKMFDTVEDQQTKYINQSGTLSSHHDPFASIVLLSAKTINHHQADGQYNMTTLGEFAKWFQQPLDEFSQGEKAQFDAAKPILPPEEIAMKLQQANPAAEFKGITSADFEDWVTMSKQVAEHYHKIATEMLDAVKSKSKTPSKSYEAWKGNYKIKQSTVSKNKYPIATHPMFYLDQKTGKLMRKHGEKNSLMPSPSYWSGADSMKASDNSGSFTGGIMFSKALPGNITVRYYPQWSQDLHHTGQNNLRSQQGKFVIDFQDWDGNIDSMHKAREVMQQFGLDHKLATHTDLEVMYLSKVLWQQKADVDHAAEYQKIQKMENSDKKIEALKNLCEKVYGIHPDKLKTYDPTPKWDANHNSNSTAGHHYWLNPYVLNYVHNAPKKKVMMPIHSLTAGDSCGQEALESIVKYGLQSTENRVKYVMPPGSSSAEDQRSGGATSIFTKGSATAANQNPEQMVKAVGYGHLVFKPELYARTDAYGYDDDNYGATNDTYMFNHSPISKRLPIMDIVNADKNYSIMEVCLKHHVSLESWFLGVRGSYDGDWHNKLKEVVKKHKPHLLSQTHFITDTHHY